MQKVWTLGVKGKVVRNDVLAMCIVYKDFGAL